MIRLDGKVVIVTGAGRGIGLAAATALAAAGAAVVVNDLDEAAAQSAVAAIQGAGGQAVAAIAAIGPTEGAELCVDRALSTFGRLDAMCANAGILRDRVLWNTTDEDFDAVIATHLRGSFTCARAAMRHFRTRPGGGRIILTASIAGQRGNFGQTAYSAAKSGIAAFARTWSMECAKSEVTVNAIVPNALTRMVATMPMFTAAVAAADRGEKLPATLRAGMGMGLPEDVAPLFVFLASEAAAAITGQCIGIGGDKLSIWSHPVEVEAALHAGGWTPDAIAQAWGDTIGRTPQTVGIDFEAAPTNITPTHPGREDAMKALMLALLAATALTTASPSFAQTPPLRIGMEEDLSTSMASVYGKGAVAAAQMAVEDFGPDVIGRKIELLTGDGQSKPDVATGLVREWFDTKDVQMVTGLSNSAIGLAVQAMARDKNRISIITGSGAPEITGAQCSPNGLHWVIDTYAIDHAVPAPLLAEGNKTWFLLAVDITIGKALIKDILPVLKAGGGTVVGQSMHPLFTTDMSSPVIAAQASKAQVVALMNVGGDLVNAAKQANEFGVIAGGQKLAGFWMTSTDVKAIGLETGKGIYFAEAFYWDQDDAARAWSKRFFDRVGAEPNSYQAGIYGAITHYLKAVKAAGTAEPSAVMAKMRELPVQDFMTPGGGTVRIDGRVVRPIQVLQVKSPADSKGPWDLARIVSTIPGDQAFRPLSESDCPLVKH